MAFLVMSPAGTGRTLIASCLALAAAALPAAAQVVSPLDLLTGRVSVLEGSLADADATLGLLRTDVSGFGTDVAKLKVEIGDLRGMLDGLPDVGGGVGPVDLSGIIESLDKRSQTNSANITLLQTNDARQDVRIEDHDRRITRTETSVEANRIELADHEHRIAANTVDIRRHDLAIADLQGQMAGGFAAVEDEFDAHDRRIDKATEGVAMAFAMKSPAVPDNKSFALSGSFGAFEGKTALAVAGGVRASEALQFDGGIAVGLDGGSVGGRAGATLAW